MDKRTLISLGILAGILLFGFFLLIKPTMDLKTLAQETCDELDGARVIVAGPLISKAIGKTERLGFSRLDLRIKMRTECPGLIESMEKWAVEHSDTSLLF